MKILRLSKYSPPKPDEEIWSFGLFIVGFVVTVFMMNKILSIDLNYIIRIAFIGVPAFIVGCLLVYLQEIIRIIALLIGFAPIFPDTCYHLTHYWPAAADIPVASDNPVHYADAIRYNARTPLQGSLLPLTRLV